MKRTIRLVRRLFFLAILGIAGNVQAMLSSNAILDFDDGIPGAVRDQSVLPLSGSYFGNPVSATQTIYTTIERYAGIRLGVTQPASGSHTGKSDGSENPGIDRPWRYFSNTGMHETASPITILSDDNNGNVTLDFSGWGYEWNGIPFISLGRSDAFPGDTGIATLTCSSTCEMGDTFVLNYATHIQDSQGVPASGFNNVPYILHLEGKIIDPGDTDQDSDNDGISDAVEVGGDLDQPLDTDADGVADMFEPGFAANNAAVASGLLLKNKDAVSIDTVPGQTLSQVSAAPVPAGAPNRVSFPFGVISYVTTSSLGSSITVRMTFSADLPNNLIIYKVDGTGTYTEIPRGIWKQIDTRTIDITLTDGDSLTDLDKVANGVIVDPIALGSISSNGGGGCVLNTGTNKDPVFLLLILMSVGYLVHRKPTRLV